MIVAGRSVLLTGATGGIGIAIARRLHEAGARLTLTGRRADVLEPLAAELGAHVHAADLGDRAAVAALCEACAAVDILVANAALPASGRLFDFSVDEIDAALDVNLRAPVVLSRLLGEGMVERGSGHIVLVSSLAGKITSPRGSLYSATKFGLRGFGQALRADLHGTGVGVSVVFPGFVRDAGMFHDSGVRLPSYVGTSSPEDVADGVLRAIEGDRGEVDVAPLGMRAGARLGSLAPGLSQALQRRIGGGTVADRLAEGQSDKRR
jgi:short-subunit dehydrogenase